MCICDDQGFTQKLSQSHPQHKTLSSKALYERGQSLLQRQMAIVESVRDYRGHVFVVLCCS